MKTNSWFTSDWHLGQDKLFGEKRNKADSAEKFDHMLIESALDTLANGDNLYFLGDLFWKYTSEMKIEFFKKFKKKSINFFWILGNHDKLFKNNVIKYIGFKRELVIEGQPITLCHYPMIVWNKSHYGAWNLFGHIHLDDMTDKVMDYSRLGKQLNVNIDFHDFKIWSFEEVSKYMKKRPDNFDLIKRGKKYDRVSEI